MRTNLDSLFNMTKQVVDGMVERGWGRVINVSSVNGRRAPSARPTTRRPRPACTASPRRSRSRSRSKGVTVNTISPGYIGTKMVHGDPEGGARHEDPAADPGRPPRQARGSRRPVIYLASDEAAFVTGANIAINGGQHMY